MKCPCKGCSSPIAHERVHGHLEQKKTRQIPAVGLSGRQRLVIYCRTTSVSAAHATHCATFCTPCQPLLRAFPGWIRSPPPSIWPEHRVWCAFQVDAGTTHIQHIYSTYVFNIFIQHIYSTYLYNIFIRWSHLLLLSPPRDGPEPRLAAQGVQHFTQCFHQYRGTSLIRKCPPPPGPP